MLSKKMILLYVITIFIQNISADDDFYFRYGKKISLTPVNSISREISDVKFFKNERGVLLGVTNKIIVKLNSDDYLDKILKDYNLTLLKKLGKNLYLLSTTKSDATLHIANELYKNQNIKYAHPDFIKKRYLR